MLLTEDLCARGERLGEDVGDILGVVLAEKEWFIESPVDGSCLRLGKMVVFEMPCVCSLSTLNQAGVLARMETMNERWEPQGMGRSALKEESSHEISQ